MINRKIYFRAGSALLVAALCGLLFFVAKEEQQKQLYLQEPDSFYYVTADNGLWQWKEGFQEPVLIEPGNDGAYEVNYRFHFRQSGGRLYYLEHFTYDSEVRKFPLKYREEGMEESVLLAEDVCEFITDKAGNVYYFKEPKEGPYEVKESERSNWMFFDGIFDLWMFDGKKAKQIGSRAGTCYPSDAGRGAVWMDDERRLYIYDHEAGVSSVLSELPADYLLYGSDDLQTFIYQSGEKMLYLRPGEPEKILFWVPKNSSARVYEKEGELLILIKEYEPISYQEMLIDDLPQKTAKEQALWKELSGESGISQNIISLWRESTGEKTVVAAGYTGGWSSDVREPVGCMNLVPAYKFEKYTFSGLLDDLKSTGDDWGYQAQTLLDDFIWSQMEVYVFNEDRLKKAENMENKSSDVFSMNYIPEKENWLVMYYRHKESGGIGTGIYEIDSSKEGLGRTKLLASEDYYLSGSAFSEDGNYYYVRSDRSQPLESGQDTLLQAGRKQPLDRAFNINARNLKKALNRPPLLYLTGADDTAMMQQQGTLRCYNGETAFDLADHIYDYLFYGGAGIAMLQNPDTKQQVTVNARRPEDFFGTLHIYENGAFKTLSKEVLEIFTLDYELAPLTEEERNQTVAEPVSALPSETEPAEEIAEIEEDTGIVENTGIAENTGITESTSTEETVEDNWRYSGYDLLKSSTIWFPVPRGWFVGTGSSSPAMVYRKYQGKEKEAVNYDVGGFQVVPKSILLSQEEIAEANQVTREGGMPQWAASEGEWVETDYYLYIKHTISDMELDCVFYMPVGANAANANIIMFENHTDSTHADTATALADELMDEFLFLPYAYAVRKGDTLQHIALRLTGETGTYSKIAEYNNLPDANLIYPGQLLRMKEEWLEEEFENE